MSADTNLLREDLCVAFAIFCDENDLTVEEGIALAERLADALVLTAGDRASYARRAGSAAGGEDA